MKIAALNMSKKITIKKTRNIATTTIITRLSEQWMIFFRVK